MRRAGRYRHRSLVLRLYLLLSVGLIGVAALLDFGFRELQARLHPPQDPWRDASLALMSRQLGAAAPEARAALARDYARAFDMPVDVLQVDDVAGRRVEGVTELSDAQGRITWLLHDPAHGLVIRVGPHAAPAESVWLTAIPPLFYLSIFVLVALWLRPLLRDLDRIGAAARAFAADYRQPTRSEPQVGTLKELAGNLDAMSARLSGLIQNQKELTSALSHEMRTPLARIRFALAVLRDKASAAKRNDLRAANEDVDEIERLIATMLGYARLDHPDTRLHLQPIPADAWLRETVTRAQLPGVRVDLQLADEAMTLHADARLMALALSNLVANACRHAVDRVVVSLGRDGHDYRLQVDDDGAGIPHADRHRVFDAFTRLDGSRSRDTGGSGLGLSIVARVAALHGGRATAAASETLGGARMAIVWPRISPAPSSPSA